MDFHRLEYREAVAGCIDRDQQRTGRAGGARRRGGVCPAAALLRSIRNQPSGVSTRDSVNCITPVGGRWLQRGREPSWTAESATLQIVVLTRDGSLRGLLTRVAGDSHELVFTGEPAGVLAAIGQPGTGVAVLDVGCLGAEPADALVRLRELSPRLVIIAYGPREEGGRLMALVSQGVVFRILVSPPSPGQARLYIEAAVRKVAAPDPETPAPWTAKRVPKPLTDRMRAPVIPAGITVLALAATAVLLTRSPDPDDRRATASAGPSAATGEIAPAQAPGLPGPGGVSGRILVPDTEDPPHQPVLVAPGDLWSDLAPVGPADGTGPPAADTRVTPAPAVASRQGKAAVAAVTPTGISDRTLGDSRSAVSDRAPPAETRTRTAQRASEPTSVATPAAGGEPEEQAAPPRPAPGQRLTMAGGDQAPNPETVPATPPPPPPSREAAPATLPVTGVAAPARHASAPVAQPAAVANAGSTGPAPKPATAPVAAPEPGPPAPAGQTDAPPADPETPAEVVAEAGTPEPDPVVTGAAPQAGTADTGTPEPIRQTGMGGDAADPPAGGAAPPLGTGQWPEDSLAVASLVPGGGPGLPPEGWHATGAPAAPEAARTAPDASAGGHADLPGGSDPGAADGTPQRIRYVAPAYPRDAWLSGQEGRVTVRFVLGASGRPEDVSVVEATPRRVFDRAALAAVQKWRYESPPDEGGEPTEIQVEIAFRME